MGGDPLRRRKPGRSGAPPGCAHTWPIAALDQTHRADVRAFAETERRLHDVEADLRVPLTLQPVRQRVERLRCFRGIDDLTALTIAAELGDARRFPSAPSVMAFVDLVPSEHSSGAKRAQGAITKIGNAHLQRVLVECVWHYRHHPFVVARPDCVNGTRRARPSLEPGRRNSVCIAAMRASPRGGNRNNTSSTRSAASSPALSGRR
jgi:transposase